MLELNLQREVLKDRYEIRGRISSGSYSEVFVARDRDDGNVVVIKALNSHLHGTPYPELEQMLSEKFQSESAILNKIRHPNMVSVLDHGDGEDATGRAFGFIVLEFMSGGDLMNYARTKPKPRARRNALLLQANLRWPKSRARMRGHTSRSQTGQLITQRRLADDQDC
jgi:serine/threonine-protein kinase